MRNLSGELYHFTGESLARGYATDTAKFEYCAHELLKIARQLNNSSGDDDDRKRYFYIYVYICSCCNWIAIIVVVD